MPKRILDVGQCAPDHQMLEAFLQQHFQVEVLEAQGADETLAMLREQSFDLVLINRKLDRDSSDGVEIVRQIKQDPHLGDTPVMLVSNYSQAQEQATAAGAEEGFGKLQYDQPETLDKLRRILTRRGRN